MELENRVVLVTGTNQGIGQALVEALLAHDVKKVYATSLNLDQLPVKEDPRVTPLELDITNPDQVQNAADNAPDTEILINNAGIISYSSMFDGPIDSVRKEMETNYFGSLNMIRTFLPLLKNNQPAAIVNIASMGGFSNYPGIGGYCASKAALYSLTQAARIELAPAGISVHSVNPGPIDTQMGKNYDGQKTSPEDAAEAILQGLLSDEQDIFPDRASKGMFRIWNRDYRELERRNHEWFHEEG